MFKTRTGSGGRGFAKTDLVVADEAMILNAQAASSLMPTQAAKSMDGNYQVWYVGSAVDQMNPRHDGIEFSRVRVAALAAASSVAWFEWSADASEFGDDLARLSTDFLADMKNAADANPSLGIRISEEFVRHEREVTLGPREFAVERLGVGDWNDPTGSGMVIDIERWKQLGDEEARMQDAPIVVAFDVTPDRSFAAIAVAGYRKDGLPHVELADHQRGTGWIVAEVADLVKRRAPLCVVCDASGPAASLLPALATLGVEPVTTAAREFADGCGLIYDSVDQGNLSHIGERELFTALRGAKKRPLGDAWAWSRKTSDTDISPLVAVTLALWGLNDKTNGKPKGAPRVIDLSAA
jgi:hypothetical protein